MTIEEIKRSLYLQGLFFMDPSSIAAVNHLRHRFTNIAVKTKIMVLVDVRLELHKVIL